ncbi:MAG: VOC family protein [Planctomycetaceae bacterium]|nr:VOC family protein [Planctomycetaceae bacterium]
MNILGVTTLLQVFDMPTSVAFYRDVLGARVLMTSATGEPYDVFDWAMLQLGNATLMLNTAYEADERPASVDAARVEAHTDTVLYFACEDARAAYDWLCERAWPAQPPVETYYGMTQVYTKDPDGYELCFQHPTPQPEDRLPR